MESALAPVTSSVTLARTVRAPFARLVRIEQFERRLVELRDLALRAVAEAEGAHEAVDLQSFVARELGDAAGACTPEEVELEETVLADREALSERSVGSRTGID